MLTKSLLSRPFIPLLSVLLFYIMVSGSPQGTGRKDRFEAYIRAAGVIEEEPAFDGSNTCFLLRCDRTVIGGKDLAGAQRLKVYVKGRIPAAYGDAVSVSGTFSRGGMVSNPGQFDLNRYLAVKNMIGTVYVPAQDDIRVLAGGRGNPFVAGAISLKNYIVGRFREMMPERQALIFGSILFGVRSAPVPQGTVEAFRKSGVVHILVASGNVVSILLGICLALRRMLNLAPLASVLFASFLVWSFAAMAGFGPAITRASVMGQITLLGGAFERDPDFYNSLCASAFFMLLFDPLMLFDIGFQLSFSATWSFVYIAPVFSSFMKEYIPAFLAESFSVALSPFLATLPITFYYFSTVSFVSVFANILVVPITEIITTLGFICSFLLVVFPVSARVPALIASVLVLVLDAIVSLFAKVPGAFASFRQPPVLYVLLYFAGLIYTVEIMKRKDLRSRSFSLARPACLLLFLFFSLSISSAIFAQKQLEITVLDVGQGDSIFIKMPGGKNILIDAGPAKAAKRVILPFLRTNGINKIDLAVLTHAHDDHVGGFPDILENIKISEVFDPGLPHTSLAYRRFLMLVEKNRIKYSNPRAGQLLSFGDVKCSVLSPSGRMESSDLNDSSIVLRFIYGKHAFLFTGDAGLRIEEKILSRGGPLRSDVLKVGHHGSRYSTGEYFLRRVKPSVAVISVARDNRYGHPSPYVLNMLGKYGVKTYRTDISGAVKITSDGADLSVTSMKN